MKKVFCFRQKGWNSGERTWHLLLACQPQGNGASRFPVIRNKTLFPRMPEGRTNQASHRLSLLQLEWVVDVFQPCYAGSYVLDVSMAFYAKGTHSIFLPWHRFYILEYSPSIWLGSQGFKRNAPAGDPTLQWTFLKAAPLCSTCTQCDRFFSLAAPSAAVIET